MYSCGIYHFFHNITLKQKSPFIEIHHIRTHVSSCPKSPPPPPKKIYIYGTYKHICRILCDELSTQAIFHMWQLLFVTWNLTSQPFSKCICHRKLGQFSSSKIVTKKLLHKKLTHKNCSCKQGLILVSRASGIMLTWHSIFSIFRCCISVFKTCLLSVPANTS